MNTERTFMVDLTPLGISSCVLLDGVDISGLLRAIAIRASAGTPTQAQLLPVHGARVTLVARLPEAQIVIGDEP